MCREGGGRGTVRRHRTTSEPEEEHRIKEAAAQSHPCPSAEFLENQSDPSMMQISQGTLGTPWHHTYHSSSSASDLSGFDHGYLRRSPDQYSSRGSMESLDHPPPGYPCHLSPAKSTNSIDQFSQLHHKRDSAYSSFSTNASIPEYQLSPFCKERSFSMENMHSRCSPHERMKQADIKYIKTVYDAQRGVSKEYEVHSSSLLKNREGQRQSGGRGTDRSQGVTRVFGVPAWNPHNPSMSESDNVLKDVPLPPARSDSYAAIKHSEMPGSWLNPDHSRSCQTQSVLVCSQPMTGSAPSSGRQPLKTPLAAGQLPPMFEASPESGRPVKSKRKSLQAPQPGQPMFPTGVYPVPVLEPHFAQVPQNSSSSNGTLYPALAKESGYAPPPPVSPSEPPNNTEHPSQASNRLTGSCDLAGAQMRLAKQDAIAVFAQYRPHLPQHVNVPTSSSQRSKGESDLLNNQCQESSEITNQGVYPPCIARTKQTHQRSASESKGPLQPLEHWRSEVQEERETNLWRRERNSVDQTHWASEKNKQIILETNQGMGRRRRSMEVKELQQREGNLVAKQRDDEKEQANKQLTGLDTQSFMRNNDGTVCTVPLHNSQPKCDQPSSPLEMKTYEFGRSRLSSSSSQSSQGLQFGKADGSRTRCSVLEKISKIEQREQECQRQHGTGVVRQPYSNGNNRSSQSSSARSSLNSIEDLKSKFAFTEQPHMSERTRSVSTTAFEKTPHSQHLRRTVRVRSEEAQWHPTGEQPPGRLPAKSDDQGLDSQIQEQVRVDLQGSIGTSRPTHSEDKVKHWKDDTKDIPGSQRDHLSNRTYRNSIKDAQSKVLRATSFRRKDLDINTSFVNKSKNSTPRPNSACEDSRHSSTSPHAPKERHSVTPTETCTAAQEYTSKEHQVARIGGRKRMTAEQKKRSYSEPEKMNEVGVSDSESSSRSSEKKGTSFTFPESTVADRRRIFERETKTCSTINLSRPELKQLQQNALADYIERKTGKRPSSQETTFLKERCQSSYFQTSMQDNESLSSASSMNSLQDQSVLHRWRNPPEQPSMKGRVSSTLPPGLTGCFDLNSFEQKTEHQESRCRSSSFANLQIRDKQPEYRPRLEPSRGHQIDSYEQIGQANFTKNKHAVERRSPSTNSGKSVSAEDLLERSGEQTFLLHVRSNSSPSTDTKSKDSTLGREIHMSGLAAKDRNRSFCTETSLFKREDRSPVEKTLSPSHRNCGTNVSECENMFQSENGLSSQRPSHRASETLCTDRTTGIRQPGEQPSHLTRRKLGPGHCHGDVRSADLGQTTSDYSTNPPPRPAAKGEWFVCEQPEKTCASHNSVQTRPVGLQSHDAAFPESAKEDKSKKKRSPPQRPPPPKIKWAHSVNEDNLQTNQFCTSVGGHKFVPRWQSLGTQSSSSSDTETSIGPSPSRGKISLRISESCLQTTPPLLQQEDEDDEVFVTETEVAAAKCTFEHTLLPPPPPAPSLEDRDFSSSIEEFPIPLPEVDEEKMQIEEKQEGMKEGIATCNCTETTTAQERPLLSRLSGEAKGAGSMNSETPLPSAASMQTSFPLDVDVPQHLLTTVAEHQDTERPPLAHQNSTSGETTLNQLSESGPLSLESFKTMQGKAKPMTQEEINSVKLAKEISSRDRSLADVLDPDSRMKTTMDLMEGLFPKGSSVLKEKNEKRKKTQAAGSSAASEEDNSSLHGKEERETVGHVGSSSALPEASALKAEVTTTMKGLQEDVREEEDPLSLTEKKNELISSLSHKLDILHEAKESLMADIKLNNALGEDVETLVKGLCKPNEFDKYKMFIGDLDKVVNLLLSLSGRLARIENVLNNLPEDATADEKDTLNKKRKVLVGQHEDARELKENLDRRERVVLDILGRYLLEEQFLDYQHFVKMKSALLIEQRELDDKIRLGQEQLKCLTESLPLEHSSRGAAPSTGTRANPVAGVPSFAPVTSSL
ncbi:protein Shroom3 isoform X2 [Lissotriton helveticus]